MTDWQPITDEQREVARELVRLNPGSPLVGMWQTIIHAEAAQWTIRNGTLWVDA